MNKKVKQMIADTVYEMYEVPRKTKGPKIHVLSVDDTIKAVSNPKMSMIRFGDGEIQMIRGKALAFQKSNQELAEGLREALRAHDENLIITIPDIFNGLDQYEKPSQEFWKDHLLFCRKIYYENCDPKTAYGSTSVSRCYSTLRDQSKSGAWFASMRSIWNGKKVTVVEGAGSHTGVTNDLLDSAAAVERILCPPSQAYAAYQEILNTCEKIDPERLVLLSIGPSAKPLGLALFRKGYRILDIGNLDTEYEWYRAGAKTKTDIPKHHILTEEENIKAGYTKYLSEVVTRIGC